MLVKKSLLSGAVVSGLVLAAAGLARADGGAAPAPNLVPGAQGPKYRSLIPYNASLGEGGVLDVTIVKTDGSAATLPSVGQHFYVRNRKEGTVFTLPAGYEVHFQALVPSGDVMTALRELAGPTNPANPAQETDFRAAKAGPSSDGNVGGQLAVGSSDGVVGGRNPKFPAPDAGKSAGRAPAL